MKKDIQKDDFNDRKNCRRKHLKNKNLDKKYPSDDELDSYRPSKENKRKIEEMREEEMWEDWEEYGR